MKITAVESAVLKSVNSSEADCGEYVSVWVIANAVQGHTDSIETAVRSLSRKHLVKCDEHGCAAITEEGVAVLKAV